MHPEVLNNRSQIVSLSKGKIPPQALDIEEIVLGALLIDSKGLDEIMPMIKSNEVFYKEAHQWIYAAIQNLYSKSDPVDLATVSQELKTIAKLETVGGDFYLIGLTQKVSSSAHIEYHCRLLLQFYIKRQLLKMASQVIEMAYVETKDVFDIVANVEGFLDKVNGDIFSNKSQKTLKEALDEMVDKVEMLTNLSQNELTGVPTGFKRLDLITGGWQPSDLIIIAGRPSMGKSALCSALTLAAATKDIPVGFISLEMSTIQLTTRLASNNSHFHLNQLFRRGFREDPINKRSEYFKTLNELKAKMYDYPVYFNDTPSMDIRDIKATARLWKRKHGIKLLIVDYLQLAKDSKKSGNREQEISSISSSLKAIAKELEIPVVALSQLSRSVETRGGLKQPQLSDLRESGAIEQDADVISFLWRPAYYDIEVPDSIQQLGGNTALFVKKNRNGSLDNIALWFDENKTKFQDPSLDNNNEDHFI